MRTLTRRVFLAACWAAPIVVRGMDLRGATSAHRDAPHVRAIPIWRAVAQLEETIRRIGERVFPELGREIEWFETEPTWGHPGRILFSMYGPAGAFPVGYCAYLLNREAQTRYGIELQLIDIDRNLENLISFRAHQLAAHNESLARLVEDGSIGDQYLLDYGKS